MSMFKRIMSVLMALLLLVGLFPQVPLQIRASETLVSTEGTESTETETTEATEPAESVPEEPATMITRVQWIQALVESFEYTLSADAMPDNYFVDITGEEEYYDVIMTAIYHGLVDSLPGTEFRPDDPATREFAAQTLNSCMGYLPSEETYSYSEYETVTYPDDIQVAVEREWFALVDGAVLPEQAITSAEMERMLADAESYVASMEIDENHTNQYTFKEGVIEIVDAVEIEESEDGTTAIISIKNCTETVTTDDIFVIYNYGLAIPYQAVQVVEIDGTTLISAIALEFGDAIEVMDVQTSMDTDPTNFYTADGAELVFIEETTGQEYASAEAALYAMRTNSWAIVVPKFSKKIDLGNGASVSLSVELKNSKVCLDSNISYPAGNVSFWLDTDVEISGKVSCKISEIQGEPFEVYVGGYEIPGVGGLGIYFKIDVTGSISVVQKYHMRTGFTVIYDALRFKATGNALFKVNDKGSSLNAEISAKVYLEAKFGLYGKALPVKGYVYAEAGFKASVKYTTYEETDGYCVHFAGYLFAECGVKIEWKFFGTKDSLDENFKLYKESNSPVKIGGHYEDGKFVSGCTRKDLSCTTTGDPSKIADSGYVTSSDSSYYGSGLSSGGSSTGYTSSGEIVTIYSYTLDEDNNATITDYNGNVSSLTIPMTIDGYPVVAIGANAFEDRTELKTVIIQDNIISIGSSAFRDCTYLRNVTLSESLTKIAASTFRNCSRLTTIDIPDGVTFIGASAFFDCTTLSYVTLSDCLIEMEDAVFQNCTSLTQITIPKALESCTGYNYYARNGIFYGCTNLKTIILEEGMTAIPGCLLQGSSIETITIPESVTSIGYAAFRGCTELKEIVIPDTVVFIGNKAFIDCGSLKQVTLSKSLKEIEDAVFQNCTSLTQITIPKALESCTGYNYYARNGIFYGCTNLKTIILEEGMTAIPGCLLQGSSIETITIPESVTSIGYAAFRGCTELKEISIPDTVVFIGNNAFIDCESLMQVTLSKNLKEVENAVFQNCTSLTRITIPKTLESCTGYNYYAKNGIFYGCTNLKTIILEEGMTAIPGCLLQGSSIETITIPESITSIGYAAFRGCTELKEIVIPDTVTYVGTQVFMDCQSLLTVRWPSSLTTIPQYTFSGCSSLIDVYLPDNLSTIDRNAFENCDAVTSFAMPDSVTTMNEYVFKDCDALTDIHLSESLTAIPQYAFADCDALLSVVIPNSVTSIGQYCFSDCDALETVTMGNKVTSLGQYAFYHCDVLKNVKLSLRLTSIPKAAFRECAQLEEIVIPYYTTSIAAEAFNSSPKLTKVVTHGNLTSINSTAFSYPNLTVFYGTAGSFTQTWAEENGYIFNENTSAAAEVTLSESQITLAKGATYTLALNIDPTDFSEAITFKSNKTSVVTVDEKGVLTAVGVGTATVKIIVGDASASCKVTVTQAVTKIKLDKTKLSLDVPETYQLTATITPTDASNQILAWASSDDSVATVDENGLVTAVGNGTVTITATATDGSGISASCTVTVTDPNNIPVSSIALNQTDATMQALEIIQLIATVGPENAANKTLSWSSSDESVAIVDQNGVVTAITKGTAVITAAATDDSGVSASCTVVVTNTAYIVDNIEDLQSSHNYENNCKDFWVYTVNGAVSLDVTFDEQTEIEDGFDYLHIYDGEGNLIGTYTGTELAGQTVNVSGSTIRIMIETDDSGTEWGFKVVSVEPTFENREYEILEGADSTWTGDAEEEVAIRVNGDVNSFVEVQLNGEVVDPENYTVTEGSTIITFKPEFLATLPAGEYEVTIVFTDGDVSTGLTIEKEEHVHEFVDGKCECGKEVSTGTIDRRSAVLELENMVRIVLKMTSYTGFEGINLTENMGLLVWSADTVLTDETATIENAEQVVEGGFLLDGVYCVKTEGIAAKELGDDLQMRIYVRLEDGSYVYDKLVSYSALKYARSTIQKSDNEELVALCKAMLNYGAAAQIAFNYKTSNLMNAELSEEDKVLHWDASILDAVESVDASKTVGLDRNSTVFTGRGAVLALEGAVNIQFRMGIAGAYAESAQEIGILYWSAETYQAVELLTAENADLTDTMVYSESVGRHVSEYPGIAPKDLGDTVYACAYLVAEDGTYYYSGVVAYSVETYITNTIKESSTASEDTKTLVKWLGIYGELAKEYFY